MTSSVASSTYWRRWAAAPEADDPASWVVLVTGQGGIGKSRLLERFTEHTCGDHDASAHLADSIRLIQIDWEDERRSAPSEFPSDPGPSLARVLSILDVRIREQLGAGLGHQATSAFAEYRRGVAALPGLIDGLQAVQQASLAEGTGSLAEDAGSVATAGARLASIFGVVPPVGIPEAIGTGTAGAIGLSQKAWKLLKHRGNKGLDPADYELVVNPHEALSKRLAKAIRSASSVKPIVIVLDTAEIVMSQGHWLREVMLRTGDQVAWVIGARLEPEQEAAPGSDRAEFVRRIPDHRLIDIPVRRFDDAGVAAYVEDRLPGRRFSEDDIERIAVHTHGVPLAVEFATEILGAGGSIDDIGSHTPESPDVEAITARMAQRYLIHTEPKHGGTLDRQRIYGLALVYTSQATDPDLLRTIWDEPDVATAFEQLAARHDFVLTGSRRLHDHVTEAVRDYLLDPLRRDTVRAANQRAADFLESRLRHGIDLTDIDVWIEDDRRMADLLGVLWHRFWVDSAHGWRTLFEVLPTLAALVPSAATSALDIAGRFTATGTASEQHHLEVLSTTERETFLDRRLSERRGAAAAPRRRFTTSDEGLDLLARAPQPAIRDCLVDPSVRAACLHLLQATHVRSEDPSAAVDQLEAATAAYSAGRAPILDDRVGKLANEVGRKLVFAGPRGTSVVSEPGLRAAQLATTLVPDLAAAWGLLGAALNGIERYQEALTAYDTAIQHDNTNPSYHNGRGTTLHNFGRYEEALTASDTAIQHDNTNPSYHSNRGITLHSLGRYGEALTAFDTAIQHDNTNPSYHYNRGITLHNFGRHEEALTAYDTAIQHDNTHKSAHNNRGELLMRVGDLDGALGACDTAIALAPDDCREALVISGAILWHLQRSDESRRRWEAALSTDNHVSPYRNAELAAIALTGTGDPERAVETLTAAIPLRVPGDMYQPELYRLLHDPPLPGIGDVERIVAATEGSI